MLAAADELGAAIVGLPTDTAAALQRAAGTEARALSAAVQALRRCDPEQAPTACADALHSISAKWDRLESRLRGVPEAAAIRAALDAFDRTMRSIEWQRIPMRITGSSPRGAWAPLALVLVAVLLLRRR